MASGYPEPTPPDEWEPDNETLLSAERKLRNGQPSELTPAEVQGLLWLLIAGNIR